MKKSYKTMIKKSLEHAGYHKGNRELVMHIEDYLRPRVESFIESQLEPSRLRPLFIEFQQQKGLLKQRPRKSPKSYPRIKSTPQADNQLPLAVGGGQGK